MEHMSTSTIITQSEAEDVLLQKSNGRLHQIINSDSLGCAYITSGYVELFVL